MAKNNNQKIWGYVVVWLVLFLIVKSIEKLLLITAVGALIFWGSRALRANREKEDSKRKNNSLKEKDSAR